MAINILVFAPSVEAELIDEMSLAVTKAGNVAVRSSGNYGIERRSAIFQDLNHVITGLNLNHYWAVLNVYIERIAPDTLKVVSPIILTELIKWAGRRKKGKQLAKIRLFGPDGKLLSDDDI